jgi:hypothetical protein
VRAISVRQPWAGAIMTLGKGCENRNRQHPWFSAVGERLAVHASGTPAPWEDLIEVIQIVGEPLDPQQAAAVQACGYILGTVLLEGVHHAGRCRLRCSPWAQPDQWHLELTQPVRCGGIPIGGALGLWQVPDELVEQITLQGVA